MQVGEGVDLGPEALDRSDEFLGMMSFTTLPEAVTTVKFRLRGGAPKSSPINVSIASRQLSPFS